MASLFTLDDVFGLAEQCAAKASLVRLPPKFRNHNLEDHALLHPLVTVMGGATKGPTIVFTGVEPRDGQWLALPYSIEICTNTETQQISLNFPSDRDETHLLGLFRARYQASLGVPLPEGKPMFANVSFNNSFDNIRGDLSIIVHLAYDIVKERTEPVTVRLQLPGDRRGDYFINPPASAAKERA